LGVHSRIEKGGSAVRSSSPCFSSWAASSETDAFP
jgi:hypothetical protein